MNKRIKKKNDLDRMFDKIKIVISLATKVENTYAHLEGYKEADDIFWKNCEEKYDKWTKLPRAKRCGTYILKKHNIPKFIGYKNKITRT